MLLLRNFPADQEKLLLRRKIFFPMYLITRDVNNPQGPGQGQGPDPKYQDRDKDLLELTPKDKDLTLKDQDKGKDLKYVLKEFLMTRTRTRATARQKILT